MRRRMLSAFQVVIMGCLISSTVAMAADIVKPQPKKKIKVPSVRIAYQHRVILKNGVTMTSPRTIDKANKNPGVIQGATLDFTPVLMTASVSLDPSRYTWSGEASGQGATIAATFNTPGLRSLTLNVFDKNSNRNKSFTAQTRVRTLGLESEATVCDPETASAQTLGFCALYLPISGEAFLWSSNPATAEAIGLPRTTCTLDDGKCNAARHSYWNLLLTRDTSEAFAARITTAHERKSVEGTGIDHGGAHNASVMDLDNNAVGRAISHELFQPITTESAQMAIINAVNSPRLTKLDTAKNGALLVPPNTNPEGSGLLEPTNQ